MRNFTRWLTILVFALLLALSLGRFLRTPMNAQAAGPLPINGAEHPELIPDDEIYALIFLTATAPSQSAKDLEIQRAQAYVSNLPLNAQDRTIFADHARQYRVEHERLSIRSATTDALTIQQRRQENIDLVRNTVNSLQLGLTPLGDAKLKDFANAEKKAVKLVPIPDMHASHRAMNLLDHIHAFLAPDVIYAQGMTPYASLYTSMTTDTGGGPLYATGTTNAFSGCNCHSVYAFVQITLPSGHQAGNTDPGGHGEVAQATASLSLTTTDVSVEGNVTASTSHYAYCPISNTAFVNYEQTNAASAPLESIHAYYYYQGYSVYHRCNANNRCDNLAVTKANYNNYNLFRVGMINIAALSENPTRA